MPQIWMTYEELGALMNCDAATARAKVMALQLDRRRSHDGNTRIKLDAKLTDMFLDHVARQWIDRELATSAADLLALRQRMAPFDEAPPRRYAASAGRT